MKIPAKRRYTTQDRSNREKYTGLTHNLTLCQVIAMPDLSPIQVSFVVAMEPGDEELFDRWFYIKRVA